MTAVRKLPVNLRAVFLVLTAGALIPAGCSVGADGGRGTPLTDALGRTFLPPAAVERIVSLSPAVTEILFAIGAGDRVAGVTAYCDYPPEALSRTKVGGFSGIQVSIEQIAALKPDLVILSADMHGRVAGLLEELSIPSFAVEPRSFDGLYETVAILGRLTGCGEGAAETVQTMKDKIALAAEGRTAAPRPLVYWELSGEPLISVGGGSFLNEAISLGGGTNIFGELDQDWPPVSAEQVLVRRPGWIFTGDDHGAGVLSFAGRPGWEDLPAVREGRVVVVDAGLFYRYGPRLADGVLEIARILRGEGQAP
ncbi:MAG: ABC transporter substrate-binding protein [Treponema sp.]|nr:ABC transporter substrate-binding protein [Treponema sp.]